MEDTYIIRVSSQKGGVGKTTIAVNLAASLKAKDYDVLLVDADVTNPSVGTLLGLETAGVGYRELVMQQAELSSGLAVYGPMDLNVIIGTTTTSMFAPKIELLNEFYKNIAKLNFEFIIVDSAPGSFTETDVRRFDEALVITTPDRASALGSQRLAQLYEKFHIRHRLVINRAQYDKFELDKDQIEKIYGDVAYALIPEDPIVKESIAKRIPAVLLNSYSQFSVAIEDLCRAYTLKAGEPRAEQHGGKDSVGKRLKKVFGFK